MGVSVRVLAWRPHWRHVDVDLDVLDLLGAVDDLPGLVLALALGVLAAVCLPVVGALLLLLGEALLCGLVTLAGLLALALHLRPWTLEVTHRSGRREVVRGRGLRALRHRRAGLLTGART